MKAQRVVIILISIVAVAIVAFVAYGKAGSSKGLDVKVITPARGVMTSSISATGKIACGQEAEVASLVSSRVVRVLAEEGQPVSRGSLLVLLDDREAFTRINSDKAALSEAHARVEQAERNLKALRNVYQVGGASLNSVHEAEFQYAAAQTAEKKAAAELRTSSLFLERFKIVAPFSGVVVKKAVSNGDVVAPGVSLLSLADVSRTEVEVSVDESDAGSLRAGQEVELSCETLPNLVWTEKILRIEQVVRKEGSANTLKAHVSLGRKKSELRLGQQVDVKIKLAEKKGALKVPFDAVIRRDGKSFVATIRDNRVHFEPVVTGLEDAASVEILSPVRTGDQIILTEGKSLSDGQRVRVVTQIGTQK